MNLLCLTIGHRRDRKRVWHDSVDWRSTCHFCKGSLVKDYGTGKWRPFNGGDGDQARKAKPERIER